MNNHRFFLLIALLSVCSFVYGQECYLTGKITDAKTAEELIGASIVADGKHGVTTDIDGNYKIKLSPGDHKMSFSYLGYETIQQKVNLEAGEIKQLDILLKSKSEELRVIVVSASQFEKNIAEETVSMEVISKDFIQNTNSRDLAEVVAKTPGVLVQDEQISIRGGSSWNYGVGSRTAVLIDGLSLQSADLGYAQLKFAPLEDVEQIEIVKGASSVVYGSSALNGVVNLRTAWPKSGEKATTFNFYYGAFGNPKRKELKWWGAKQPGLAGVFFNHKQRFKHLQLIAGANIDYIQSYLQRADEFRVRGNFKLRYIHPKNEGISFGINGNIMKELSERFFISKDLDSNAYEIAEGSGDNYLRSSINPHFTLQNPRGHRLAINLLYFNVFRKGAIKAQDANSNSLTFDVQYQKNWNDRFILTSGVPILYGNSKSNLYPGRRTNYTVAVYSQFEYRHEKFSIVAGLRYEFSAVDSISEKGIPVGRFGINYHAGKSTHLRGSFGQAYRIPSIGEKYIIEDVVQGVYIIPNPDLEVEKGWSCEIGIKQGLKIKKWKGFFDFAIFLMQYKNYVEYLPGLYKNADPNGKKYIDSMGAYLFGLQALNVEEARILGFEPSIAGTGFIGPVEISVMAGYTYIYPGNLETDSTQKNFGVFLGKAFRNFGKRIDSESEDIDGLLQFRYRHMVRSDIEATYKKWSLGLSFYYNSFPEKIPGTFILAASIVDGGKNTIQTFIDRNKKGDFVMDGRIAYRLNDKFRLSFIVKNMTNQEYANRPGKLEPPVNFTLQFRVTL